MIQVCEMIMLVFKKLNGYDRKKEHPHTKTNILLLASFLLTEFLFICIIVAARAAGDIFFVCGAQLTKNAAKTYHLTEST